uniref:Uncharacterized protein n=1 Tax=Arundo donax TaxID=35708 RepID=A0A0A9B504_ARUDO
MCRILIKKDPKGFPEILDKGKNQNEKSGSIKEIRTNYL